MLQSTFPPSNLRFSGTTVIAKDHYDEVEDFLKDNGYSFKNHALPEETSRVTKAGGALDHPYGVITNLDPNAKPLTPHLKDGALHNFLNSKDIPYAYSPYVFSRFQLQHILKFMQSMTTDKAEALLKLLSSLT